MVAVFGGRDDTGIEIRGQLHVANLSVSTVRLIARNTVFLAVLAVPSEHN
jgi:hypothetical protein